MIHRKVISSNIQSVAHDAATNTMEVVFHSGGHYRYENVSASQHKALMSADSKGEWLTKHVVKRPVAHPSKKVERKRK